MPLRKMSRVLDLAHDEYRVGIDQNPGCVRSQLRFARLDAGTFC